MSRHRKTTAFIKYSTSAFDIGPPEKLLGFFLSRGGGASGSAAMDWISSAKRFLEACFNVTLSRYSNFGMSQSGIWSSSGQFWNSTKCLSINGQQSAYGVSNGAIGVLTTLPCGNRMWFPLTATGSGSAWGPVGCQNKLTFNLRLVLQTQRDSNTTIVEIIKWLQLQ